MEGNQTPPPATPDPTQTQPVPPPVTTAQTPPQAPQPPAPEPPKSGGKKFIILAIVVLVAALLLGGAYYFVIAGITPAPKGSVPAVTQAPEQGDNNSEETVTDPAPSPTEETATYAATKIKDLSLSGYTLTHPKSWVAEEEKDEIMQTLTLSKEGYVIKINQAPTGGNFCVFEGEMPDGPATDYRNEEVVEIDAAFGLLRRTTKGTTYSFCEQNAEDTKNFFLPTSIGFITYTVPANPDTKIVAEMDAIITSIAKTE